jgi:hypothetical protein
MHSRIKNISPSHISSRKNLHRIPG